MFRILGQLCIMLLTPLLPIIVIGTIIALIAGIIAGDTAEEKAINVVKTLLSLGLLCLSIVFGSSIILLITIIISIVLAKKL